MMQYNAFVNQFNQIISESALNTPFLQLMRQRPHAQCMKSRATFLLRLFQLARAVRCPARSDGGEVGKEFHHRELGSSKLDGRKCLFNRRGTLPNALHKGPMGLRKYFRI